MVVLDPRTGRLVSISLGIQPDTRTGPAAPRPARPPREWPPHHPEAHQEPPGAPPARLRIRREES